MVKRLTLVKGSSRSAQAAPDSLRSGVSSAVLDEDRRGLRSKPVNTICNLREKFLVDCPRQCFDLSGRAKSVQDNFMSEVHVSLINLTHQKNRLSSRMYVRRMGSHLADFLQPFHHCVQQWRSISASSDMATDELSDQFESIGHRSSI